MEKSAYRTLIELTIPFVSPNLAISLHRPFVSQRAEKFTAAQFLIFEGSASFYTTNKFQSEF